AWVDHFESWRRDLTRREDAADIRVALEVGAALIDAAAGRARPSDGAILAEWSADLRRAAADVADAGAGANAGAGTIAGVDTKTGAGAAANAKSRKAMALDAAR